MAKRIFHCEKCKTRLFRHPTFDAYYCCRCDKWSEEVCGDLGCPFGCHTRPDRPSQAKIVFNAVTA
jgi:hypothetical protein